MEQAVFFPDDGLSKLAKDDESHFMKGAFPLRSAFFVLLFRVLQKLLLQRITLGV